MRQLKLAAGERKRILHLWGDSLPQQVRFRCESAATNDADPVGGEIAVQGSRWLFLKPEQSQPLKPRNVIEKGIFDTRYSIYVTPDRDCQISFESRHFTGRMLAIALLIVLALGIGSPLFFALLRASSG